MLSSTWELKMIDGIWNLELIVQSLLLIFAKDAWLLCLVTKMDEKRETRQS